MNDENNNIYTNNDNSIDSIKICNKCGRALNSDGKCDNCISIDTLDKQQIKEKKEVPVSAIILLVICIANITIAVPIALYFSSLWLIFGIVFGGFSSDPSDAIIKSVIPIILWCGYCGASVFGLIAFIINLVKYGKFLKKAFLITFIGFIFGIIVAFILPYIIRSSNKEVEIELEKDAIIYQDENYIIRQKELTRTNFEVKLTIDIEKLNLEADELIFNSGVSINNLYLTEGKYEKRSDSEEIEFILHSYELPDKIESFYLFFEYGDKKGLIAKLELDGKVVNIKEYMESIGYKVALENEYFRVYFKPNTRYHINLFVEGKSEEKYSINISEIDANTHNGKLHSSLAIPLYESTTYKYEVSYYPCDYSMKYLKIYYTIYDENKNEIIKDELVEKTFENPQFDTRYCKMNQ